MKGNTRLLTQRQSKRMPCAIKMNYNITSLLDEHDFRDKKRLQEPIVEKYQYFNKNKTNEMIDCGRYLEFALFQNKSDRDLKEKKLDKMYTCKDRFCPFCNWRRARKLAIQSYEVLEAIQSEKNVRYLFVTLTVRNCPIGQLSDTITYMNKAFKRMIEWKRLKGSILGWSRILEYPPQKTDPSMMHPHYHCLIAVPTGYFGRDKNMYIKQEEWQSLWKKALKVDYDPSVDVRVIKAKNGIDPIAKAVAEFAKYPLKSVDIKPLSVDQFQELAYQMKRKRAVAFGGILKEYRKKLSLDDVEDGDLVYSDSVREEEWQRIATLIYQYKSGEQGLDYYLKEINHES